MPRAAWKFLDKTIETSRWLVYILRCKDGSFYTGITSDLTKRLAAHQNGTASRYTRSRLPVKLIYLESAANRSVATKRELKIKRLSRSQKETLLHPPENDPTTQKQKAAKKQTNSTRG